ncbi:MAG: hypothetical protein JKY15_04610 [Deltaproteobacteria bacterium]|nr:hypothetical protein [Deltaproteobacteria bacterium]
MNNRTVFSAVLAVSALLVVLGFTNSFQLAGTGAGCSSSNSCASGQICDFLVDGFCQEVCTKPGDTKASGTDGTEVCNPITRTYEPICNPRVNCRGIVGLFPITPCNLVPGTSPSLGYCSITCSRDSDCGSSGNLVCSNSTCRPATCGNGKVEGNEVCDEGSENGLNGRCSLDCFSVCAGLVFQESKSPFTGAAKNSPQVSKGKTASISDAFKNGLVNISKSKCSGASPKGPGTCVDGSPCTSDSDCLLDQSKCADGSSSVTFGDYLPAKSTLSKPRLPEYNRSICPCGYGLWVANTTTDFRDSVPVAGSINIYGGFAGTEQTIDGKDGRVGAGGNSLGQNEFSGTIFKKPINNKNAFEINSGRVTVDGFQFVDGEDTAIVIGKDATATLQNLRISRNTASKGGGISNSGTMHLRDSMVELNTATTEGGGLYHNPSAGDESTIERVTFYGNGINADPPAGCVSGNNSPPAGSLCSSTTDTCQSNGLCKKSSDKDNVQFSLLGGAISAAGKQQLTITDSRIQGNYSYGHGGGIYAHKNSTVELKSTFLAGNWSSWAGGAFFNNDNSSSSVTNSCFVDNRAYNQGGGGVYTTSTKDNKTIDITNSVFGRNKGLYPVNNNNMAEWGGNRVPPSNQPPWNQINSISFGNMWAVNPALPGTYAFGSKTPGTLTGSQFCPAMSYNNNGGGDNPVCDGSDACGTRVHPSLPVKDAKFFETCLPNASTAWDDCQPPLYETCANACAAAGLGCSTVVSCDSKTICDIKTNTCVQCLSNSDCTSPETCDAGVCSCGTLGKACPNNQTCENGSCRCSREICSSTSDGCSSNGICTCGGNFQCGPGFVCDNGVCKGS